MTTSQDQRIVAPTVGYGTFTAIYGMAWLAGAARIGVLDDLSIDTAISHIAEVCGC